MRSLPVFFITCGLPIIAALFLVACGGGGEERTGYRASDHYHEVTLPWKGKNLYCVERGGSSHGTFSGLSCDWVGYHMAELIEQLRSAS